MTHDVITHGPEATAAEPVFVDPTGRRRRLLRGLGLAAGGLCALFLAGVGLGAATGARVPMTPWTADGPSATVSPAHPRAKQEGTPRSRIVPAATPREVPGPAPASRTAVAARPEATPAPTARATAAPRPSSHAATPTPGHGRVTPPAKGRTKKP
ncbi:hypothetical protein [Actinomadura rayongensis]|uniref:Uncharacterized protein n=1 Tax=Actinomadura rayongensis TaxID=1429076 RepID=A0A6I4WEW3_9ACTN|nr:hypothetical protein [Actinomadura rayongensis]MXQ68368.1 hypothetical protein [Actinomadura rayongensis]